MLHGHGFSLLDPAFLKGNISCEKANEISREIESSLRNLQTHLSVNEKDTPNAELVAFLTKNLLPVKEDGSRTFENQARSSSHERDVDSVEGKDRSGFDLGKTDDSSCSVKTPEEGKSLDDGTETLNIETGGGKFLFKKSKKLNVLLVLKRNLRPESLAKINRMIQFLPERYPKVTVKLADTELEYHGNLIDLVVACGGDGTLLLASSLFTKHVPPIIGFKAGNLNYLMYNDLDDFEAVFESLFSGKNVNIDERQRLVSSVSKGAEQTTFAINEVLFCLFYLI